MGWGRPRPQPAHHLLTCILMDPLGQAVGTSRISASQPLGSHPLGDLVSRFRCPAQPVPLPLPVLASVEPEGGPLPRGH